MLCFLKISFSAFLLTREKITWYIFNIKSEIYHMIKEDYDEEQNKLLRFFISFGIDSNLRLEDRKYRSVWIFRICLLSSLFLGYTR